MWSAEFRTTFRIEPLDTSDSDCSKYRSPASRTAHRQAATLRHTPENFCKQTANVFRIVVPSIRGSLRSRHRYKFLSSMAASPATLIFNLQRMQAAKPLASYRRLRAEPHWSLLASQQAPAATALLQVCPEDVPLEGLSDQKRSGTRGTGRPHSGESRCHHHARSFSPTQGRSSSGLIPVPQRLSMDAVESIVLLCDACEPHDRRIESALCAASQHTDSDFRNRVHKVCVGDFPYPSTTCS